MAGESGFKYTHTHTEVWVQIEKSMDISASHPAELLSAVHAHDHCKGGAGWLSHRAEELKVLKQGGVCGIGARRKMKVFLAWHKAGFNHAQHHLPLKQMGAVCLRGAPIPTAVQGLVRSQCSAEGDGAHHSQGSWSQHIGQ